MQTNKIDTKEQLAEIETIDLGGDDEGFVELKQVTVIKHEIQCDPKTHAQEEFASTTQVVGDEHVETAELEELDAAALLAVAKAAALNGKEAVAGVFKLFSYTASNAANKTGVLAKQAFEYSGFAELAEEVTEYIADRTEDNTPTANEEHAVTNFKSSQAPKPGYS